MDSGVIATNLAEKGLYLDCSPTSQSTNTLPALTLPLDVNGNVNLSNSLLYSSIMNSLILFIIIVFVFLSLPSFYKFSIVDLINKVNVPDKATRLTTVTGFIFTIFFLLSVSLIFDGFSHGNIYESYAGIMVGLMLVIGTIRIFYLRNNKDYNFQKIYNWNPIDIYEWLKESYTYSVHHSTGIGMNYLVFNAIIILLLVLIPLFVSGLDKFIPSTDTFIHVLTAILSYSLVYNLIFAPFAYLIYDTFKAPSQ